MTQVDPLHYSLTARVPLGSVIKYRYVRQGNSQVAEYRWDGQPVRYRQYYVDGPGVVTDIVGRWSDTPLASQTGRIVGQVLAAENNAPLPNILVSAGGAQGLSASDGSFVLDGLPQGKHVVVAYALDGAYQPFKHEAVVAAESATPVVLDLRAAPLVNVTFSVSIPSDTVPGVPIRIAGNLLQLGSTFAELSSGASVLANRMPVLEAQPDGRYLLNIKLPAGADVRYKYTLGDGLWNAEHASDGSYRLRQIIIPEGVESLVIEDFVTSWQADTSTPVWFDITVPTYTPESDQIYVQFYLFGWREPIPMWQNGENQWGYRLFGPTNVDGGLTFRYCRNAQCGSDQGIAVEEKGNQLRWIDTSLETLAPFNEPVTAWKGLSASTNPVTVLANEIQARDGQFIAGVEFLPDYNPSWDAFNQTAMQSLAQMNANWVALTPTWHLTNQTIPRFDQVLGKDILWPDLARMIANAQSQGLQLALFPQAAFPTDQDEWWSTARRDGAWWQSWFEGYRTFTLHHADVAAQHDVETLILGGEWLTPALPQGKLANGDSSLVPSDAEARWSDLLAEIRQRFSGQILWALPYSQVLEPPPPFLDQVDGVYLLWSAPLSNNSDAGVAELEAVAGRLLDDEIQPLQRDQGIPVILAIAYPSASGGITGCIAADSQEECLSWEALAPTQPEQYQVELDLQEQVEVYNALLAAVNERPWIDGVVSRGYYPPVALEDKSASVHGKPAADVLHFWFSSLLEK